MMIAVPTPTFPSDNNFVPIVAEKTIQPPTDRSIPPVRITNVMPIAAMPQVTDCVNTLLRFETERNLSVNIDELYAKYALSEDYAQETELKEGQFITDLNGAEEIDIYDLLYQSVILNLPNKKVCGINSNGKEFHKEEDLTDPRLDGFKNIKIEGQNG